MQKYNLENNFKSIKMIISLQNHIPQCSKFTFDKIYSNLFLDDIFESESYIRRFLASTRSFKFLV